MPSPATIQLFLDSPEKKARFDRNRKELTGSFDVSTVDVFPPSFMRQHTDFATFESMLSESRSALRVRTEGADSNTLDRQTWDSFVRDRTRFNSWEEMKTAGCTAWLEAELVKERRSERANPPQEALASQPPGSLSTVNGPPWKNKQAGGNSQRSPQPVVDIHSGKPFTLTPELLKLLGFAINGGSHPTIMAKSVRRTPPLKPEDEIDEILGLPVLFAEPPVGQLSRAEGDQDGRIPLSRFVEPPVRQQPRAYATSAKFSSLDPLLQVAINGGGRVEWYGYWPKGGPSGEDTYFVIMDGAVKTISGPNQAERVLADSLVQATLDQQRNQDWTRFWGEVQAFGGFAQTAGGVLLLVTSGPAGWIIAIPVILKGIDNSLTGAEQARTGIPQQTFTNAYVTEKTGVPALGFAADVLTDLIGPGWDKSVSPIPPLPPAGKKIPTFHRGVDFVVLPSEGTFPYHWGYIDSAGSPNAVSGARSAILGEVKSTLAAESARLRALGMELTPVTAPAKKPVTVAAAGSSKPAGKPSGPSTSKSAGRSGASKSGDDLDAAVKGETSPPGKTGGGGSSKPPKQGEDKLGEGGITQKQKRWYDEQIAKSKTEDEAMSWRYKRYLLGRKQNSKGGTLLTPDEHESLVRRNAANNKGGRSDEQKVLDDLGVPNNNTEGRESFTVVLDDVEVTTIPDGLPPGAILDVKSSSAPGVTKQSNVRSLKAQQKAAEETGRLPVVVLTGKPKEEFIPRKSLAEKSTVLHGWEGKWHIWTAKGEWSAISQEAVSRLIGLE